MVLWIYAGSNILSIILSTFITSGAKMGYRSLHEEFSKKAIAVPNTLTNTSSPTSPLSPAGGENEIILVCWRFGCNGLN